MLKCEVGQIPRGEARDSAEASSQEAKMSKGENPQRRAWFRFDLRVDVPELKLGTNRPLSGLAHGECVKAVTGLISH